MQAVGLVVAMLCVTPAGTPDDPFWVPEVIEPWWSITEQPDLGVWGAPGQEPVDFGIWQARNGTWQGIAAARSDGGCFLQRLIGRDGRVGLFREPVDRNARDPLDFGQDDDGPRVGCLPVAAPEIFPYKGRWYVAALKPNLDGIRVARLRWRRRG